jgi:hypothetical protein
MSPNPALMWPESGLGRRPDLAKMVALRLG